LSDLQEADVGKKLYVGNLSFGVTDQSLSDAFAQCGTVESARVITDRDTGRSKGFGFVEMSSDAEAADAIAKLNETDLDGRPIRVSEARPMEPRSGGGGGFGGGGGGRGGRGGGGGYRR
jgi:RNA recognition motif-containing protein